MKRFRWQVSVIGLIAMTAVSQIVLDVALAQKGESPSSAQKPSPFRDKVNAGMRPASAMSQMAKEMAGKPRLSAVFERINEQKQQLKKAQGIEREDAFASIQKACNEYFDEDMLHRRSVLEQLKKRADETKALIEKRFSSKAELIDLQLKSFQFEADGLEFASSDKPDQTAVALFGAPNAATSKKNSSMGSAGYNAPQEEQRSKERQSAMGRVMRARQMLNAAEGDEAEKKATDEMKSALAEYFDLDLASRRKAIDSVLDKLKSMESRLEKRANAKAPIVELQVQMVINEADGLGFFSEGETATQGSSSSFNRPMGALR